MSVIAPSVAPVQAQAEVPARIVLGGLALTSFATLLLELALTRLFSVVLFYHFAFLAISIALLGLGAGGVFAYLLRSRLAMLETRRFAALLCMANAVAVRAAIEFPEFDESTQGFFRRFMVVARRQAISIHCCPREERFA